MKYLAIVSPPEEKPRRFELKGKRIGLGREVDNDICVNVDSVSSSHLEFRKTDDGYELIDLDSTNGTRVNGKKVEKAQLEDGDRILVGETVPVHFVGLAEGENYEAKTDAGTEKDQAEAVAYASMSDRLDKLEANIEAKEEELETLKKDFATQQAEHQKAQVELDKLQAELESKKAAGSAPAEDVAKLEEDLMKQTKKVKLMATNLATQEKAIDELELDQPAATAPAAAEAPAQPALPKAPSVVPPRKPLPPGSPTVKLTKKLPNPGGPPRMPKRPTPPQDG